MKKHLSTIFAICVTVILSFTIAMNAFAISSGDIVPNFTSLILGNVSDSVSSSLSTGDVYATGLVRGASVKTNRIIPTASELTIVGSANVLEDLSIEGELEIEALEANSIGYFYDGSAYCAGSSCSQTSGGYYYQEVACESGDVVVNCDGATMGTDAGTAYSRTYADGESCKTISEDATVTLYTQAICFSPDGEPAAAIPGEIGSLSDFVSLGVPGGSVSDVISDYLDSNLDSLLQSAGYATQAEIESLGFLTSDDFTTTSTGDLRLASPPASSTPRF